MQTAWRTLVAPKIAFAGEVVTAQINGLDPRRIHSLKVTALGSDGIARWESPPVVLAPPAEPSHRLRRWTLILGLTLTVLAVLRWRASRMP